MVAWSRDICRCGPGIVCLCSPCFGECLDGRARVCRRLRTRVVKQPLKDTENDMRKLSMKELYNLLIREGCVALVLVVSCRPVLVSPLP